MRLTKNQRQLILLGTLLFAIVGVIGFVMFKPPHVDLGTYAPKSLDTRVPDGVLKHPVYRGLSSPVALPIVPGKTGRDNPFEPY